MPDSPAVRLKSRIRADLAVALKNRNKPDAELLRVLIAAIDNAEAPPFRSERLSFVHHEFFAGSAEVERLLLDDEQLRAVLSRELKERQTAAVEFERAGVADRALALRRQLLLVERYMKD